MPKQNLNCTHTCGRIRSSTLNATCDPNIDLQFATASSLVKLGNRNLLCSEAMLSQKEIKMAGSLLGSFKLSRSYYRTILIGSPVLTLERGHWERGFLRDDVRAFRETGLRVSRVSPLCGSRAIRPVGRGGAMGAPAPPPQTAEVHFFVKKINSKKKIIVLFCLPRCTQGGLSLAHF